MHATPIKSCRGTPWSSCEMATLEKLLEGKTRTTVRLQEITKLFNDEMSSLDTPQRSRTYEGIRKRAYKILRDDRAKQMPPSSEIPPRTHDDFMDIMLEQLDESFRTKK